MEVVDNHTVPGKEAVVHTDSAEPGNCSLLAAVAYTYLQSWLGADGCRLGSVGITAGSSFPSRCGIQNCRLQNLRTFHGYG